MKKLIVTLSALTLLVLSGTSSAAILKEWAVTDATGQHGLWTNNRYFNGERFFRFQDDLRLVEFDDGTARLTGHAGTAGDGAVWDIDILWGGFNEEPEAGVGVKTGGGPLLDSWTFYHDVISGSISTSTRSLSDLE
jgi:hypothetical protein